MRHFYICLVLILVAADFSFAQELAIGQISFRLGMTMQEANAKVNDPFYVDQISNKDGSALWAIRQKQKDGYTMIGSLTFRNYKLETIERNLGGFLSKDAHDAGRTLFLGVELLKRNDPTVSVNTQSSFTSSIIGEVRTIEIGTGQRRIRIIVPDERGTSREMSISEILTLAPPSKN